MKDILRWVTLAGIFLVPFLPLIVANTLFFPFITGKNFAFRIIVEVIFATWMLLALMDAQYRPKFSWIFGAFVWLIVIMFFADALGVSPHKSFWSNFERMEGYVSLAHLFLYFVVASATLTTEKLWNYFWYTTIGVAVLMSMYAFGQIFGFIAIDQSDVRIDARLGNAAYLAIYMLFNVYIAVWMFAKSRIRPLQILFAVLALVFVYVMLKTGTRGTIIALAGSALLTTAYIAAFEREHTFVRKTAAGLLGVVILLTVGFIAVKDTAFIKKSPTFSRLSEISLKEAGTRFTIWSIAIEGIKQRPILGWGQENFNYVFNQDYKASLYAQEPWFDRVHDIAFDWLIAGGILGFVAYALTILTTLYYATVRPLYTKYAGTFTVTERGIILGVLAGYVIHNIFVFDNLVSYTLFTAVIALVHARIGESVPSINNFRIEDSILKNIVAPTIGVVALVIIYMVNIPGIMAANDLIDGFQAKTPDAQYAAFDSALSRGSFGDQEIREQLTRITQSVVQDPNFAARLRQLYGKLPPAEQGKKIDEIRKKFTDRTDAELAQQLKETPDDVRILVFLSSYYRVVGKTKDAIDVLERAIALSPEKQQVHFELGLALLQQNRVADALARFKVAYELEPSNVQARTFYAMAAIYAGDEKLRASLITPEFEQAFVTDDNMLRAYYETKNYPKLIDILTKRIVYQPDNVQIRVSLAAIQNESGDKAGAVKTLEDAIAKFPDFKTQGEQFLAQLRAGATPK